MRVLSLLVLSIAFLTGHSSFSQILESNTQIFIEDGEKRVVESYKILVKNAEDRNEGEVSFTCPGNAEFKILEAKIIDENGQTVKSLRKKEFQVNSAWDRSAFYQDDKKVSFSLQWNDYPYQIHYSYEITYKEYFFVTYWSPVYSRGKTTLKSSLELHVPEDYKMHYKASEELKFTEETLDDGVRKLAWTSLLYRTPKYENYPPDLSELAPKVIVLPDTFLYDVQGSMRSWKDVGQWYAHLNENADTLPVSEREKVDVLLKDCKSVHDTIRTLYNYLQDNTVYVLVSIEYGGYKSYPASYVCQNKYGDCKALTSYMKALLKHAGIKSHYAIISSGKAGAKIEPDISAPMFNHVVLCVPLDNDTLWLENTGKHLPYDYIHTDIHNRYTLFVDDHHSKLIQVPALVPEQVKEERIYTYDITQNAEITLVAKAKVKGERFEDFVAVKDKLETTRKKESLESFFSLQQYNCESAEIIQQNRNDKFIELHYRGKDKRPLKKVGDLIVLDAPQLNIPDLEKPSERKLPVRFTLPVNTVDTISYSIANLSSFDYQLPETVTTSNEFGAFKLTAFEANGKLNLVRQFTLYLGEYSLEKYPELYDFLKKIKTTLKKSAIVLTPIN